MDASSVDGAMPSLAFSILCGIISTMLDAEPANVKDTWMCFWLPQMAVTRHNCLLWQECLPELCCTLDCDGTEAGRTVVSNPSGDFQHSCILQISRGSTNWTARSTHKQTNCIWFCWGLPSSYFSRHSNCWDKFPVCPCVCQSDRTPRPTLVLSYQKATSMCVKTSLL